MKRNIHKYTHPNDRRKEFLENRTSWKWYTNKYQKRHDIIDRLNTPQSFEMLILLEILKELQYLNDKK